jgi:hypothetical protein
MTLLPQRPIPQSKLELGLAVHILLEHPVAGWRNAVIWLDHHELQPALAPMTWTQGVTGGRS